MTAINDTTLLIANELDAAKRARFNAASITSGQTRVITIPDQDITLGVGSGDVVGPASATDNALVRFNGTTGKLIKVSVDDVSVADGGTGASTAADARTNLVSAPNTPKFLLVTSDAELTNGRVVATDANSGIALAEVGATVVHRLDINALTADATPDRAADYVATYDASAAIHKKVLVNNLLGGTGTALLDFGTFPGSSDASIAVTGQTGIVAGSIVQAWLRPVDTADHLADEHLVETLRIEAGNIVAGTGFTIYGSYGGAVASEPTTKIHDGVLWYFNTTTTLLTRSVMPGVVLDAGGKIIKIYGEWAIQWRWS